MKVSGWLRATLIVGALTFGALIFEGMIFGASARAGGESSAGGADDYRIVPAFFRSWRWNAAPVRACFLVSDNFHASESIPAETIAGMIRRSFEQWGQYIGQKRLDIVHDRSLIRTELDLRHACQGDEELTFYFGVENEMIARFRGQFAKPYGFAQLMQADAADPASQPRGFVWIAPSGTIDPLRGLPQWSPRTADALYGLLLHEVGHVFGNGHVDGTAMTEKIGKYLENDAAPAQSSRNVRLYDRIDSQIELVPCMECRMAYRAARTFDPIQPPGQDSDEVVTFRLLTGHEPVPPVMIRYERLGSPQGSGKLTLFDSTGKKDFGVDVEGEIGRRQDSTPLFSGQGGTAFYSFGVSYFGRIRTSVGKDIHVAVNYNMDGKKAGILPLGTGDFYPRPIFVSED